MRLDIAEKVPKIQTNQNEDLIFWVRVKKNSSENFVKNYFLDFVARNVGQFLHAEKNVVEIQYNLLPKFWRPIELITAFTFH